MTTPLAPGVERVLFTEEQIAFLGSAERLHPMRIEAGEQLRILRLELAIEGPGEVGEAERIVQV